MKTNYLEIVTENRHNVKKGAEFTTESKLFRALGLNGSYKGTELISVRKAVKSWFEYSKVAEGSNRVKVTKKYNKCRDIYTRKYRKDFPNFAVEEEYDNSIGVYVIALENQIYIGSTTVGFRKRFKQHNNKDNKLRTKEMLAQGAVFNILQICDGMDEVSIRRLEQQWIEEYRNNPEWTVVNDDSHVKIKGEQHRKQKEKPKYKTLKLTEEEYDLVIEYLSSIRATDIIN